MSRLARRSSLLLWMLISLLVLGSAGIARAGEDKPSPKSGSQPAVPADLQDPPGIGALKYRSIGPAWGGRVARVAGVAGDPQTYWAAAASGGVWKSEDGGNTWKPVFDEQPVSSIGSLAIAPSDPNVVYVGSGEANIRGNVAAGNGIYKSTDGGKTWTHVWTQEGQIGTMVVHPKNPDVAFAAVLGHAFGPNPERGVYRTTDGGKTWKQVLKKNADTGASDIALDPSNPEIVFAGLWEARRFPWDLKSGGPGSGLWVSHDGGDTWKQLTATGLPDGIWGKVGVAVAPSDGRRVYALIEAEKGGLYRSDDGGATWKLATAERDLRQRAWYYSTLTVNPANPDEIWCPQVPLLKSIDGGHSFQKVKGYHHGDMHDAWIDPKDPKRVIVGNDGGVDISTNSGETWFTPPLPIGQFYHVSVDSRVPFHVAGALQDIGTAQGPSNSLSTGGIRNADWHGVGGGEAGWVVSDPSDPNIVYAGEYLGILTRYDDRTGDQRNISPWPDNPSGWAAEKMTYRFQWTAPIAASPHDPKTIYYGGNVVFRTKDGGQTWTTLSGDLTRDDKSKQQWAGGPITGDMTGVETYDTVFVIAESPVQKGVIWAGSDDGLVHVSRDDGATWQNVTKAVPGLPDWGTVDMIEPGHFDAGTAYLVVDAHRLDDVHPYLWKTADFGRTWKRLDGGLPRGIYLHTVREDPTAKGTLYLGTERGVAFSTDDGANWRSLKLNLPAVAVHDLQVKDNSLVLATHGRSMWIFDDLPLVRALSPQTTGAEPHLFNAPDAVRWTAAFTRRDVFRGANPPQGAFLYYWLKDEPKGDITLDILDASGRLVTTLSSKAKEPTGSSEYVDEESEVLESFLLPKKAGVQRAVWDLNWAGAAMIPNARLDSGFPLIGPPAVPGTYTARLTVDGKTQQTTFKLLPDPRSHVAPQDLDAQLAFALEVRDEITRLTHTVIQLKRIRRQLDARDELLADNTQAADLVDLVKGSKDLIAKLDDLESRLHNPKAEVVYDILAMKGGAKLYSRLAPLLDTAKTGDGAPTQGMRQVFAAQKKELDGDVAELQGLIDKDLAALNATAAKLSLPTVWVPPLGAAVPVK
ncbi:MAG TPA: glycosyl hydrolase [Thermoanaerobaculia bacterium]|nr:glycosyl hydrolase [Thermoanaerobaculia bacterium]